MSQEEVEAEAEEIEMIGEEASCAMVAAATDRNWASVDVIGKGAVRRGRVNIGNGKWAG